jgi:hypothetical protein
MQNQKFKIEIWKVKVYIIPGVRYLYLNNLDFDF